jgi:outer membrane lipopolysaccharide assembly protein LptE/RlpB
MKTLLWRSAATLAVLLLVGCGYGLIGRTSNLPEDIDSIFVETLENRTTRQQINLYLTQAIVNEFVTRRRYAVVASAAAADAVLSGVLTAYIVRPVEFGPDGRATRYEFTIRTDMEFKRTGSEEVLWGQDQYVYRGDFELRLDEGQGTVIDNEDPTIQLVSREFAQTLVIDMLEGF